MQNNIHAFINSLSPKLKKEVLELGARGALKVKALLTEARQLDDVKPGAQDHPAKIKLHAYFEKLLSMSNLASATPKSYLRHLTEFFNNALKHMDLWSDTEHAVISGTLKEIYKPSVAKELYQDTDNAALSDIMERGFRQRHKNTLKHFPHEAYGDFFLLLHIYNQQSDFAEALAESRVPVLMARSYKTWIKQNQDYLDRLADASAVSAEPENVSGITYIDIDHALVVFDGADTVASSAGAQDLDMDGKDSKAGHAFRQMLENLFLQAGVSPGSITVRRDVMARNPDDTAHPPYDLIDIETDTLNARIAVCQWTGHTTFVTRDPRPMERDDSLRLSVLRDDPKTWTVRFCSESQWTAKIRRLVFTPVEQLEPELKHRSSWFNKKQALIDSFVLEIARMGKIPSSKDESVIEFGPLAGRTTWVRAYASLQGDAIEGLDGVRTFNQLYRALAGANPVLGEFLDNRPPEASAIFNACAGFIKTHDLAPQKAFYDSFDIAGWKPGTVSEAFRLGAVRGLAAYVPPHEPQPVSLEDFIEMTRLAKRDRHGELVPA